jgi:hypothetical protein
MRGRDVKNWEMALVVWCFGLGRVKFKVSMWLICEEVIMGYFHLPICMPHLGFSVWYHGLCLCLLVGITSSFFNGNFMMIRLSASSNVRIIPSQTCFSKQDEVCDFSLRKRSFQDLMSYFVDLPQDI